MEYIQYPGALKELDKFKIKVNKKIQYQIDLLENYIKQSKKAKKEKEL